MKTTTKLEWRETGTGDWAANYAGGAYRVIEEMGAGWFLWHFRPGHLGNALGRFVSAEAAMASVGAR